mgnify:CR=1 FL=1
MKTIEVNFLEKVFETHQEKSLYGKWIHYAHISPLLKSLSLNLEINIIGKSENNLPIHSVKFGIGSKRILIWTQMHGNESTGTKALFDLLNYFSNSKDELIQTILRSCSIYCIPMLNPDGSLNYTRVNQNGVDLNRDAVDRKAKESKLLRSILEEFDPMFCFNMHDQRTIFGVEGTVNPATISFLAPSEEQTRKLTKGRKETMDVIVSMNELLQKIIPNHIGRYTDEFYPTATGDNFQKLGYNTILIEAGHYPNDYDREQTRKYNFFALIQGMYHIAISKTFNNYQSYFKIPNNQKNFFDVIRTSKEGFDRAYLFVDKVINGTLVSELQLEKEGDLRNFIAHSIEVEKK